MIPIMPLNEIKTVRKSVIQQKVFSIILRQAQSLVCITGITLYETLFPKENRLHSTKSYKHLNNTN